MKYYYLDAIAGGGKTHTLIQHSTDLLRTGKSVLFVLPSLAMVQQCREGLAERQARDVIEVTSRTGKPIKDLMAILNNPPLKPQIILCTHAAFLAIPHMGGKNTRPQFHIIVDEEVPVIIHFGCELAKTHHLITDHIEPVDATVTHSRVRVKDRGKIRELAETQDDDAIKETVQRFARRLISGNWDNYLNTDHFRKLISGEASTFTGFSILRPSIFDGFASVTMGCALFEDTELFNLWKNRVCLKPHVRLMKTLPQAHENGPLITIYYAVEDDWSKNLRDKDERKLFKAILKATDDLIGDNPLLIAVNKDIKDEELAPIRKPIRLPNTSHGLNSFMAYDDVAFLSARNPQPPVYNFMRFMGIDAETLRMTRTYQQAYQAVMRSSNRDRASMTQKRIIVPSLGLAKYLQSKFPGSTIKRLTGNWDTMPKINKRGRTKTHASNSAKVAAHRNSKSMMPLANQYFSPNYCNDIPITSYKNFVTLKGQFFASEWPELKGTKTVGDIFFNSNEEFFVWLKSLSKRELVSKDDNTLISPSYFEKKPGLKSTRAVANVIFANGIMLDNDGFGILPEQFAVMFPELKFIAYNTFSSTKDRLRYRICIPTSRPMCAFESYAIIGLIFERMEKQGFLLQSPDKDRPEIKAHGFDPSKKTPNSMFYLPSQAEDPEGSFFHEQLEEPRKPLDVDAWMKLVPVPEVVPSKPKTSALIIIPTVSPSLPSSVDAEAVTLVKATWRNSHLNPGTGNYQFWCLAEALRRAGMDDDEALRQTLTEEAMFGRSPEKRLAEIDDLVERTRPSSSCVEVTKEQEGEEHAP